MSAMGYTPPDYYNVDELLTNEQKLVRSSARDWVNRAVIPIIDEACQNYKFPIHLIKEMGLMELLAVLFLKNTEALNWIIFHTVSSCRKWKEAIREYVSMASGTFACDVSYFYIWY